MADSRKRQRAPVGEVTPLELRYFPLLAKGLGPALVLQFSGIRWRGNYDLKFTIKDDWPALKEKTPFGQLPLLSVPSHGLKFAQTTAIINYVGRLSGIEGATDEQYALSQMLIAEAEDIYLLMVKFLPTPYKRLSTEDAITTSKGTRADFDSFYAAVLPKHLAKLERLWKEHSKVLVEKRGPDAEDADDFRYLTGELYLWSMLYQAWLAEPNYPHVLFDGYANLSSWFGSILGNSRTKELLNGKSPMGKLSQYFLDADSKDICSLADERGRWG